MMESTVSSSGADSTPHLPHESPGSSVSSRLMDEYEELLRYAVVVPAYDPGTLPKTISDVRGSFGFPTQHKREISRSEVSEHDSTIEGEDVPHIGDDDEEEERDADVESHDGDDFPPGVKHPAESTPLNLSHEAPKERPRSPIQLTEVDKMLARQVFHGRPGSPASSISSHSNVNHYGDTAGYSVTVDQDITRMDGLMDTWLLDLKRNVLAEFSQTKIRLMELHRQNVHKEREKVAADGNRLQNEMEGLKELLHTYEQSIERKDQVISNLTRAMQQQKDRFDMSKTFCEWKIRHNDAKREEFASNLARKHYEKRLSHKVWGGWHSIIESRWRNRVEKACQAKAQEVCMQLTNDYEAKIASLNEALESARNEVDRLHRERETYEETMKKAFMRGVCALNLEAMNMFNEAGDQVDTNGEVIDDRMMDPNTGVGGFMMAMPPDDGSHATTVPHEPIYSMEPPGAPIPRVVTGQAAAVRMQHAHPRSTAAGRGRGSKVISAKVTGRPESASRSGPALGASNLGVGLAPPMSSVLVERHQPVTKQTIGHATASRFPRGGAGQSQQSGIVHRKIAGQAGKVSLVIPNVQTVKMVE